MQEVNADKFKIVEEPPNKHVVSFLKKVWNHPLLTEATIQHRSAFPAKFQEWCEKWKLDPNQLVAVPAGSSRWIVDEKGNSDWDFILYGPRSIIEPYINTRAQISPKPDHTNQLAAHPVDEYYDDWPPMIEPLAPLLLTPDNFIAGNKDLAAKIRLRATKLKILGSNDIGNYFDVFMKGWPERKDANKRLQRKQRLESNLDRLSADYANRTGLPKDKYTDTFYKVLNEIEPPPIDIYIQAIKDNQGKILLPPSDNIKRHRI